MRFQLFEIKLNLTPIFLKCEDKLPRQMVARRDSPEYRAESSPPHIQRCYYQSMQMAFRNNSQYHLGIIFTWFISATASITSVEPLCKSQMCPCGHHLPALSNSVHHVRTTHLIFFSFKGKMYELLNKTAQCSNCVFAL